VTLCLCGEVRSPPGTADIPGQVQDQARRATARWRESLSHVQVLMEANREISDKGGRILIADNDEI